MRQGARQSTVNQQEEKMDVYEMTAEELYAAFFRDKDPQEIIDQGRTALAARLQTGHNLKQDPALYAADEILAYAQHLIDLRHQAS
jgi:uncharacterized protein YciW